MFAAALASIRARIAAPTWSVIEEQFPMSKTSTPEAAVGESDPLRSISEAMRDAIDQASDDAAKASEKVRQIGAGAAHSASRFAYTASYTVSYGVVYATVFIAKSIPQNNPIVEGFVDGGRAALDALNEARSVPVGDSVPNWFRVIWCHGVGLEAIADVVSTAGPANFSIYTSV
jgi:hypothetical protein